MFAPPACNRINPCHESTTMSDIFTPFDSPALKAPLDEEWAAKRELAEATRQLIETLVTTTSDANTLQAVTASLRQQVAALAAAPRLQGRKAFEEIENGRFGTLTSLGYELNPLDGKSNPISPPFSIWIDSDVAHGRATLGWQYEGPPATVHGGFVCAIFDQFLGIAQLITGQPGVTGTLTTRFHRPTPLNVELKLIGRVKDVKGRKNILTGEIWANDVMTASCEGLFIHISKERFLQMRKADG